jgi:transposase
MSKEKEAKRGRGRPTKLSPETREKLVEVIEAGNYYSVACQASGISYHTFLRWMERGEDGEVNFCDFCNAIKKAEATAETRLVAEIQKDDSWQSKAWMLERKHPDRWGRKERVEHTGTQGQPMELRIDAMTPEQRQQRLRELERKRREIEDD